MTSQLFVQSRKLGFVLAAAALLLSSGPAGAGEQVHLIRGRTPSAQELADRLFPETGTRPRIQMRSIVMTAPAPEREPETIGALIQFGFDSSEILAGSRPFLDELGRALQLAQAEQERLVIEGHTDAVGAEGYNLWLSELRAEAVRSYLVREHGVDEGRLLTAGRGEVEPLSGFDRLAAENRRVQFRKAD